MPSTTIQTSSWTECINGERITINRVCNNGNCDETRLVEGGCGSEDVTTNRQTIQSGSRGDTSSDTSSDNSSDTSSDNGSDNGCSKYADKTFSILINDIDITLPSFIISLVVFIMVIIGFSKLKKK